MTLEKVISELNFAREIERAVLRKIHKDEKQIEEIAATAYQADGFDYPLCSRMPLTRLSVVTFLLTRKYDEYKAKGIPDGVIFDSFRDVSLRAALYYRKTGKSGLSRADVIWFRHIMNVSIFKIEALQFQPFKMIYLDEETIGEQYMSFAAEQKRSLPAGSPVLNCHIQEGADLSPEAVARSFRAAGEFFSAYFSQEKFSAFLCYSWLLYRPMWKSLPDQSNIKRFAERFEIIGECSDSEQAEECLFGHDSRKGPVSNLTFLQRLALEHPDRLGFACGIIKI